MRERVRRAEGGEKEEEEEEMFLFNGTISELFNLGYREQKKEARPWAKGATE